MSAVHILLAILTLAAEPEQEPLDAFRANFAAIKVDMEFTCQGGRADPSVVGKLSSLKEPKFDESPGFGEVYGRSEITGRWAFDGTTQLYAFGTPDWVFEKFKTDQGRLPHRFSNYIDPREELFDGKLLATHEREREGRSFGSIHVYLEDELMGRDRPLLIRGAGPFIWWWGVEFPAFLDEFPAFQVKNVPKGEPERHSSKRDGHPVVVEVYSQTREILPFSSSAENGPTTVPKPYVVTNRSEISYDPTIGYLPRYARRIVTVNGSSQVLEMSLVDARRCSAGGFVPTEWYSTLFSIDDFAARYPSYDHETLLEPTERIELTHFKASSFKDCTSPVALTHVENHKFIGCHHNAFLLKPGVKSLTMADIKSTLGPWLDDPTHPILPRPGARPPEGPDPDADPLHLRPVLPWPVGVGFLLVAGFLLVRHQKRKATKG